MKKRDSDYKQNKESQITSKLKRALSVKSLFNKFSKFNFDYI